MDDHHLLLRKKEKEKLPKSSGLKDEEIGIFTRTGACEKLARRHQCPSLFIAHRSTSRQEIKAGSQTGERSIEETINTISGTRGSKGRCQKLGWYHLPPGEKKNSVDFHYRLDIGEKTNSKDLLYLWFYNIYVESGFDRLMGVQSTVLCMFSGSDPAAAAERMKTPRPFHRL